MTATAPRRINHRFSATAGHAACLRADHQKEPWVELWMLSGTEPTAQQFPTAGQPERTQPIPTCDGRVVLVRGGVHRHTIAVVEAQAGQAVEQIIGTVEGTVPHGISSADPAVLTWLIAAGAQGRSVIYRVSADGPRLERVLELEGRVRGDFWLAEGRNVLAVNQFVDGNRRPVVLDLDRGTTEAMPGTGVVLGSPGSGTALVTGAHARLGLWRLGEDHVDYPPGLDRIGGTVAPLALAPDGHRIAVRVTEGSWFRVLLHDARTEETTEVSLPRGVVGPLAGWNATGLHLVYSSPNHPAAVHRVSEGSEANLPITGRNDVRLEQFDGPAGPIEAVVYGPDWTVNDRVLLALHGGPDAAWSLAFDPVFQRFADAGLTVIAPNQRGSIGYGAAHRDAINGAWGGPDLEDIRELGRTVGRSGRPLMIFGVSYGAYLAGLAAAVEPDLWSHCVMVSPFVSGPDLYAIGSPSVRALIDRLGGRTEIEDAVGHRNLARLAHRIRATTLIVHGAADPVIPVSQARTLAEHLPTARYREIAGARHDPLGEAGGQPVLEEIVELLLARPYSPLRERERLT